MYCRQCGKQLDEEARREFRFCPGCGTPLEIRKPNASVPGTEARGAADGQPPIPAYSAQQDAAGQPAEKPAKKDGRTIIIVLVTVLAALLVLTAVLFVRYAAKKNAGDPNETAQSIAQKEEAFRGAIHISDVSAYPDCDTAGYIDTYVGDLNGDDEPEYIAFHADFESAGQPGLNVHLYDFDPETAQATKVDELAERFDLGFAGNGMVSLCAYADDTGICINQSSASFGGETWGNTFTHLSVQNGRLTVDAEYVEVQSPRNNMFVFEEKISGAAFASEAELAEAAKAAGLDVHWHEVFMGEDGNFTEPMAEHEAEKNHLFLIYRNAYLSAPEDTGYIRFFQKRDLDGAADETQAAADETQAAADVDMNDVMEAYREKVKQVWALNEGNFFQGNVIFVLYDFDENGVPELILDNGLRTNTEANEVEVFTYTGSQGLLKLGSADLHHSNIYDITPGDGEFSIISIYHAHCAEFVYRTDNETLTETVVNNWHDYSEDDEKRVEELASFEILKYEEWTSAGDADTYFDSLTG